MFCRKIHPLLPSKDWFLLPSALLTTFSRSHLILIRTISCNSIRSYSIRTQFVLFSIWLPWIVSDNIVENRRTRDLPFASKSMLARRASKLNDQKQTTQSYNDDMETTVCVTYCISPNIRYANLVLWLCVNITPSVNIRLQLGRC